MFRDIESGTIICKHCGLTQNEIDGNFTIICNCRNNHAFIHENCVKPYINSKGNLHCIYCDSDFKVDIVTRCIINIKNIFSYLKY